MLLIEIVWITRCWTRKREGRGRPHGGIGFIANRVKGITYKPISVDCDRITGMQLVSNGKIVMTIFGVYLPYSRANADQIKLYSETLDILQSAIDGMDPSPIMIVGDMNAPLPRQSELSRYWYRVYPFNRHSYILYDFLRNNDFEVANFNFEQDVSYTYFNTISRSYIYISIMFLYRNMQEIRLQRVL